MDVDPQELAAARPELRRVLGSDLVSKASDAFCLADYRRRSDRPATPRPGLAPPGVIPYAPIASVVEFAGGAPVPRLPRLTNSPDWSQLSGAFEVLSASISTALPVRVPVALRQVLVEAARAAAYRVVTPAYDEIERLSGRLADPAPSAQRGPQVLTTQVCWLNRTLRTWAGPEVLAEVAADEGLTGVDVPRRIEPDVLTRNHVAVGHDEAFVTQSGLVGAGVSIAMIDTEVALTHPALTGRVVHRGNYTAEPWGNPSTHGTAVAGIIAADDPVNGGIAPAATVYNYKIMATDSFLSGDDFGGALAI